MCQSGNDQRILLQSMLLFLIIILISSSGVIFFPIFPHSTASSIKMILVLNYASNIMYGVSPLLYIALNPLVFFLLSFTDSTLFRRFRECFLQMFKIKATTIQVAKSKIKSIIQHPLQGCNT